MYYSHKQTTEVTKLRRKTAPTTIVGISRKPFLSLPATSHVPLLNSSSRSYFLSKLRLLSEGPVPFLVRSGIMRGGGSWAGCDGEG